jgi:stearoyl-CoA desaturase (delta-9 desaturase)
MFNLNMFNFMRTPSCGSDAMPESRPLVDPSVGHVRFSVSKTAWLYGMAVPAFALGLPSLTLGTALAAAGLAFATICLGHSVGLHRGVIHRAFALPRWLRATLLLLYVQTGLGGPLSWIRVHHARDTHQNRPAAPPYFGYGHGLLRDFVWNLHLAFTPSRPSDWQRVYGVPREIEEDRLLLALEATWRWQVLAALAGAALAFGVPFAASAVCGRVAATIVFHWLIGYASHVHGRVRYAIPGACEVGRDSWVLGAVAFGEGFHNSHHAFPRSARMGLRPLDVDLGHLVVCLFERLHWIRDVIRSDDPRARRPGVVIDGDADDYTRSTGVPSPGSGPAQGLRVEDRQRLPAATALTRMLRPFRPRLGRLGALRSDHRLERGPAHQLLRGPRRLAARREVVAGGTELAAQMPRQRDLFIDDEPGHDLPLVAAADGELLALVHPIASAAEFALHAGLRPLDARAPVLGERDRDVVGVARVAAVERLETSREVPIEAEIHEVRESRARRRALRQSAFVCQEPREQVRGLDAPAEPQEHPRDPVGVR